MAITAGNYIIRSALDESIVLLTSGGSKSKGAIITAGALTEEDSRCYWKAAIESSTYNKFYNLETGTKSGYIMGKSIADGKGITQGAFKAATGTWNATLSGNTMEVDGQTVNTYFLTAYSNANLYLTVPDNGGDLYLSTALDDTTPQEFYFEASTYVNPKLTTPTNLTNDDGTHYIISSTGASSTFYPQWNSAKTSTIYEMRSRTRMYDDSGNVGDWGDWSSWSMIQAAKASAGIMRSATTVTAPAVDNSTNMQADIQVETRLTSAKNSGAYNKTGSVTHGASVSGIISKWKSPTLTISSAECTQYGLQIAYSSDYTIAGNLIGFVSVMDGADELVSNYVLTNQDYQGNILIPWDAISVIPDENDTLDITMSITESNGIVSTQSTASVTVTYDSEEGLTFSPTYTATSRLTIEAKISAYDSIECYMQRTDLRGNEVWTAVEEIESADVNYRIFEVIPAFGIAPTIMWIVTHTSGGVTQWGYKKETLGSGYDIESDYVAWNWIDDNKAPHAFLLKYNIKELIKPEDEITLPATKFITTGRDYPIFRYTKSIERELGIEGAILHDEVGAYSTKAVAETLSVANHTVYRLPSGKWYQTALESVSFERERMYDIIQIKQEAESR